jgi:transcriptional antiterminator NusG
MEFNSDEVTESPEEESGEGDLYEETRIYTIKTTIGQERNVADAIEVRAHQKKEDEEKEIVSVLSPMGLRGYIFLEGFDPRIIETMIYGIKHCRGIVKRRVHDGRHTVEEYGTTPLREVEPFLTPKPLTTGINAGDIVELVAGPFKGERGRVKAIDMEKEEITVELIEALVPIPVTVRGDHVRVLEKEV